ncbi:MAG: sulfatase-like hydrolase/transferase [Bacteroidota bacterium]
MMLFPWKVVQKALPFIFVFLFVNPVSAQQDPPPNILLILVDDLGYGDLSSYGATDLQTPHIDALIASGMRFDEFYANSSVCSPTRASLLTGRYPAMVGVPGVVRTRATDNWGYLAEDAIMLPAMLKRNGYHTAMVGKWHLGLESPNRPHDRGFDYFKGYLGDMMDDYYTHRRHGINYMRFNDTVIEPEGHATDLFTDWSKAYIRSRTISEAPFFLYLSYNAPHTPIQPPEDWVEKVKAREEGIDDARARLVALIEHMDAGIGEVMATLEDAGYADNTVVVFTSDNGGQLNVGARNGAVRDGKQSMYEGGIKVPAGVAWPGHIDAGTRSSYVGITMDIFSTLVDIARVPVTHFVEGVSFLPTLMGEAQGWRNRDLFFSRREGGTRYGGKTVEAMRRGDWKLLQDSPFKPQELYNLAEDPLETNNLLDERPDIYRSMAAALRAHIREGGRVKWQP